MYKAEEKCSAENKNLWNLETNKGERNYNKVIIYDQ